MVLMSKRTEEDKHPTKRVAILWGRMCKDHTTYGFTIRLIPSPIAALNP